MLNITLRDTNISVAVVYGPNCSGTLDYNGTQNATSDRSVIFLLPLAKKSGNVCFVVTAVLNQTNNIQISGSFFHCKS